MFQCKNNFKKYFDLKIRQNNEPITVHCIKNCFYLYFKRKKGINCSFKSHISKSTNNNQQKKITKKQTKKKHCYKKANTLNDSVNARILLSHQSE